MKTETDNKPAAGTALQDQRAKLNEALVPVLGFSQTLLHDPDVSDPLRREFLTRIVRGARRLTQLINLPNEHERNEPHGNHTTHR